MQLLSYRRNHPLRELGKLTGAISVHWEQFRTRNYDSYNATRRS